MFNLNRLITPKASRKETIDKIIGLHEIGGFGNASREADIIFIHGLGGDALNTWHPKEHQDDNFWLNWLSEDIENFGVLSFGYEAEPFDWKGTAMPLFDQASNLLEWMESKGIGDRPIIFITHSLGGLLVKKMLNTAQVYKKQNIIEHIKGIIFLSTPHTGSHLANLINNVSIFARTTVSVEELSSHTPQLRELNEWYRENIRDFGIATKIYYETRPVHGILVVDEDSANPGIEGVKPIAIPENHITIAKPTSRNSLVYLSTKRFIHECLQPIQRASEAQVASRDNSASIDVDKNIIIAGNSNSVQIGNHNINIK